METNQSCFQIIVCDKRHKQMENIIPMLKREVKVTFDLIIFLIQL